MFSSYLLMDSFIRCFFFLFFFFCFVLFWFFFVLGLAFLKWSGQLSLDYRGGVGVGGGGG